jgi:hypothetical protein
MTRYRYSAKVSRISISNLASRGGHEHIMNMISVRRPCVRCSVFFILRIFSFLLLFMFYVYDYVLIDFHFVACCRVIS